MAKLQDQRRSTWGRRTAQAILASIISVFALILISPTASAETPNVREELKCLALNIYFEARGEPDAGKVAVGHVVINRMESSLYPDTICDVIKQGGEETLHRCQFSWWCDGRSDQPTDAGAWEHSRALAQQIYWDLTPDPTSGALWYHATYVAPSWRTKFVRGPLIGDHIFYLPTQRIASADMVTN